MDRREHRPERRGEAAPPEVVIGSETGRRRNLKRLALLWAQAQGFHIGSSEASAPALGGCRLDVAAYRPERGPGSLVPMRLGATAIFECKQARPDFIRDSRSATRLAARLQVLHCRREVYEGSMKLWYPSLGAGDALFPDLDSYRFEGAGYQPYKDLLAEIARISSQLHRQTKFDRLARWNAANLHYVVAEPGIVQKHELPAGWGLLIRRDDGLAVEELATWHEASEQHRWALLFRIAQSGARAAHRGLEQPAAVA